ncbi:hypothetical protein HNY73_000466 [Argiope bruennichi]|uniref:Uncharacterized protein n=1 Tax=Argiope bruennichi TaxID=94029 RepID=A0A8T0G2G9_ARGBR|nr:hypothetical protein HNY73_000466 [Argiope bruennichi]
MLIMSIPPFFHQSETISPIQENPYHLSRVRSEPISLDKIPHQRNKLLHGFCFCGVVYRGLRKETETRWQTQNVSQETTEVKLIVWQMRRLFSSVLVSPAPETCGTVPKGLPQPGNAASGIDVKKQNPRRPVPKPQRKAQATKMDVAGWPMTCREREDSL